MEEGLHIVLSAQRLGEVWGIPITNTLLTAWIVLGLLFLVWLSWSAATRNLSPGVCKTYLSRSLSLFLTIWSRPWEPRFGAAVFSAHYDHFSLYIYR